MTSQAQKNVLIPADAPHRSRLERALRDEGWTPLPYGDASEAEAALSGAPPSAVILRTRRRKTWTGELVKTVRRVCPDAFVLGMGDRSVESDTDSMLREKCTPEEVLAAIRLGEAMRDARIAEHQLRERLRASEEETLELNERVKELEKACTRLQDWAQSVQELALHDELTSLYNRRHFLQAAEQELERSRREHSRFAIAMIDIDHFKERNDAYGHLVGDDFLRQFARCLEVNLRRMDTVARYGGEEFIVLLPETRTPKGLSFNPVRLVERLRAAIEGHAFENTSNDSVEHLTVSAGVALYPADAETIEDLIRKVDARLYRAKSEGRNRVCTADT